MRLLEFHNLNYDIVIMFLFHNYDCHNIDYDIR